MATLNEPAPGRCFIDSHNGNSHVCMHFYSGGTGHLIRWQSNADADVLILKADGQTHEYLAASHAVRRGQHTMTYEHEIRVERERLAALIAIAHRTPVTGEITLVLQISAPAPEAHTIATVYSDILALVPASADDDAFGKQATRMSVVIQSCDMGEPTSQTAHLKIGLSGKITDDACITDAIETAHLIIGPFEYDHPLPQGTDDTNVPIYIGVLTKDAIPTTADHFSIRVNTQELFALFDSLRASSPYQMAAILEIGTAYTGSPDARIYRSHPYIFG